MSGRFWLITLLSSAVTLLLVTRFILPRLTASTPPAHLASMTVGKSQVFVEIAATPEAKQQGLSGRASLPLDQGLHFVFNEPSIPSFWMKDMRFALDFIWINTNRVVDLTENVPPPDPSGTLPIYQPRSPVTHVLEVNAGWVKSHHIQIGAAVVLPN